MDLLEHRSHYEDMSLREGSEIGMTYRNEPFLVSRRVEAFTFVVRKGILLLLALRRGRICFIDPGTARWRSSAGRGRRTLR